MSVFWEDEKIRVKPRVHRSRGREAAGTFWKTCVSVTLRSNKVIAVYDRTHVGFKSCYMPFSLECTASFTNTQLSRTVGFSLGEVHSGDTSVWIQKHRTKTKTHQIGKTTWTATTALPPSEECAL